MAAKLVPGRERHPKMNHYAEVKQDVDRRNGDGDNCLVTGGAGFIGSHVATELLARGYQVTILDDFSGGFPDNVPPGAAVIEGSICDATLVQRLFEKNRFSFVFHIAAYAAEGLSHFIRRFNYTTNLLGSVNLINSAVNTDCKCFVFTSSIAVYGSGQTPMTEESTPQPEDPYGVSKLAVELDLRAAREQFGLNYIVFRPHNVYGERQNVGDRYRNVIGIFMNRIMQGLPCTIFGDGRQTRAFTYISDIAPVIADSIRFPVAYGEVFNVGANTPYSVLELAEEVQRAMGRHTGITSLPPRQEVVHAFSDHSKTERFFGVRGSVSLREGLDRMAAWAWKAGARQSQDFSNIEIERNLPTFWSDNVQRVNG